MICDKNKRIKELKWALRQLVDYCDLFLETHVSNRDRLKGLVAQAEEALEGEKMRYRKLEILPKQSTRKRNKEMQKELERKAKAQKRYNQLKDIIDDQVNAQNRQEGKSCQPCQS